MAAKNLNELEAALKDSHSDAAIEEVRAFSDGLNDIPTRLTIFNATGALVRPPILAEHTKQLGFDQEHDNFVLLQGDIVSTESAYYFGERVTGNPKYVVLNSSCDLVPGRRKCASLLRVSEIRDTDQNAKTTLNFLLKFRKTESMYLPVLDADAGNVMCNVAHFDGICQIKLPDLLLANRLASLSLVGWRIFGSFSRIVLARANDRECDMRRAIEQGASPSRA